MSADCLPLAAMVAGESLLGVLAGDLIWLVFWESCWDAEAEEEEFTEGLTLGAEQIVGDDVRRYLPSRPKSSLRWCVCWSSLSRILQSQKDKQIRIILDFSHLVTHNEPLLKVSDHVFCFFLTGVIFKGSTRKLGQSAMLVSPRCYPYTIATKYSVMKCVTQL